MRWIGTRHVKTKGRMESFSGMINGNRGNILAIRNSPNETESDHNIFFFVFVTKYFGK